MGGERLGATNNQPGPIILGLGLLGVILFGLKLCSAHENDVARKTAHQKEDIEKCLRAINWTTDLLKKQGFEAGPKEEPRPAGLISVPTAKHKKYVELENARSQLESPALSLQDKTNTVKLVCRHEFGSGGEFSVGLYDEWRTEKPKTPEARTREALEVIEKSNREYNKIAEDQLADYRRRAVSTYSTNGNGSKVDGFVMENGQVIICRTSVVNGMRATSCQE